MFHLYYDTNLTALADRLADLLARRDAGDVLVPRTVLVPQAGLQRWLVQHLAERHGIAANLEFLAPAQMVWRVLRTGQADLPKRSAFDADLLRWRVLALLHGELGQRAELAPWLAGEPAGLRRFQLAARLAQVFQRYQGYRREVLLEWEGGQEPADPQAILWRALRAASDELPRSHLLGELLQAADEYGDGVASAPLPGVPASVFAFGCINVSPDVLRFLGVLGRHGEVHFFLPTPCGEYWGDVRGRRAERAALLERGGGYFEDPDNPLLVSMGAVGRDFVAQVFGYDEVMPDQETLPEGAPSPRTTLLQRVQADVIERLAPAPFAEVPDPADSSFSVHACHSPLREVQVLHDALLSMFADPALDLEPRDVAVLVPDLATYAPCVDAVFGALPAGDARRIPWTVADRAAASTHAIVGMFLGLLDLPSGRLSLPEVLDVLGVPAVARARGIESGELAGLGQQLQAAGVRWGEDENDRVALGLPPLREYSWAFGRDRLLSGYLLGDADDDALVDGVAPITDLEGRSAQVLGEALRIQRHMLQLRAAMARSRAPAAWQELLNHSLAVLVPEAEGREETQALESIRDALSALAEDAAAADCEVALDWRSLRDFLGERLAEPPAHQQFLAGGVSVCGMVPLRSVPFRVICVLGLNARDFPRQDSGNALDRIHADLLAHDRRLGDRSLREDDRYLFLQTVMAAGERLYLSWTGMDARKGTALEPSIALAELLETVSTGYFRQPEQAREALLTRHPLQPFSPRLFDGADARVFTYRHEWRSRVQADAITRPFVDQVASVEAADASRLALADLTRWLARPHQTFLQRQGLALTESDAGHDEREPLSCDNKTQARARKQLFDLLCRQPDLMADAARHELSARALLPPLALGREAFADYWDDIHPQAQHWAMLAADGMQAGAAFSLDMDGITLHGRLPDATRDGSVPGWVGSDKNAERWIGWWTGLLARQAYVGGDGAGVAFGQSGDALRFPRTLALPEPALAKALLQQLVDLYQDGLRQPAAYATRVAWTFVQAWDEAAADPQAMRAKALDQARAGWDQTLARDGWTALALRGRDPLAQNADGTTEFELSAQTLFVPLWQALKTEHSA